MPRNSQSPSSGGPHLLGLGGLGADIAAHPGRPPDDVIDQAAQALGLDLDHVAGPHRA